MIHTECPFIKDPQSILDYGFNWADWLQSGEAILTHIITVTSGLVMLSSTESGGIVVVWLSGGIDQAYYAVACRVSTDAGRTDERTFSIQCIER